MANTKPTQGKSWLWIAVVAMMILPGIVSFLYLRSAPRKPIDSLAVLPFAHSNKDPLPDQMSQRVTMHVYQQLSRLPNLKVVPLESAGAYHNDTRSAQAIGHELGVRAIVKGSVDKRAAGLYVTAELLDAGTNDLIWSGQYQLQTDDPDAVPDAIANDIADHIRFH